MSDAEDVIKELDESQPDAGAIVEATDDVVEKEEATTLEEDQEAEGDGKEAEPEKKPKGVQKRINDLTRQKYDEVRKRQLAEQKLEELKGKKTEVVEAKPRLDDFESLEEFQEALVDWKLADRDKSSKETDVMQNTADKAATQQATVEASVSYLIDSGAGKYDDFQSVAGTIPPSVMNDDMLIALGEIDSGADIAYYLGKNPAEAAELANLSPVQMGRALAKIESSITAPVKSVTKAPEPITPGGNRAKVDKDPSKMTDKEFNTWRRKQISKR